MQLSPIRKFVPYADAAAEAGKKAYTAPIAYYNLASCYEELNKTRQNEIS